MERQSQTKYETCDLVVTGGGPAARSQFTGGNRPLDRV